MYKPATQILQKNKLKVTAPRKKILQRILNSQSFFSAQQLKEQLEGNMDLATVYRVLHALEEKKIIREVFTKESTRFYETICEGNLHPHFLCKECSKIFCLDSVDTRNILALKKYNSQFDVHEISVHLFGVCSDCKVRP